MAAEPPLHESWHADAVDGNGREMRLRLAVEQIINRGFSAHAYVDRGTGEDREMLLGSIEYAETGPTAFQALRAKLMSERGLDIQQEKPPRDLMAPEWQRFADLNKNDDETTMPRRD